MERERGHHRERGRGEGIIYRERGIIERETEGIIERKGVHYIEREGHHKDGEAS